MLNTGRFDTAGHNKYKILILYNAAQNKNINNCLQCEHDIVSNTALIVLYFLYIFIYLILTVGNTWHEFNHRPL